jgi:hypothetical protein
MLKDRVQKILNLKQSDFNKIEPTQVNSQNPWSK